MTIEIGPLSFSLLLPTVMGPSLKSEGALCREVSGSLSGNISIFILFYVKKISMSLVKALILVHLKKLPKSC
jgi:hypothetical protein